MVSGAGRSRWIGRVWRDAGARARGRGRRGDPGAWEGWGRRGPPWDAGARRGHREDAGGPAPHGLSFVGGIAP